MPRPPALQTAATNGGLEIHDIPGNTSGYRVPNKLVMRVWMDEGTFAMIIAVVKKRDDEGIESVMGSTLMEEKKSEERENKGVNRG